MFLDMTGVIQNISIVLPEEVGQNAARGFAVLGALGGGVLGATLTSGCCAVSLALPLGAIIVGGIAKGIGSYVDSNARSSYFKKLNQAANDGAPAVDISYRGSSVKCVFPDGVARKYDLDVYNAPSISLEYRPGTGAELVVGTWLKDTFQQMDVRRLDDMVKQEFASTQGVTASAGRKNVNVYVCASVAKADKAGCAKIGNITPGVIGFLSRTREHYSSIF